MPEPGTVWSVREYEGLSVEECAKLICVPPQYWMDCEAGKKRMHQGLWTFFMYQMEDRRNARNGDSGKGGANRKYGFHALEPGERWVYHEADKELQGRAIRAMQSYQSRSSSRYSVQRLEGGIAITRIDGLSKSEVEEIKGASRNRKYGFHDLRVGDSWTFEEPDRIAQGRAVRSVREYQTRTGCHYTIDRYPDKLVITRVQ